MRGSQKHAVAPCPQTRVGGQMIARLDQQLASPTTAVAKLCVLHEDSTLYASGTPLHVRRTQCHHACGIFATQSGSTPARRCRHTREAGRLNIHAAHAMQHIHGGWGARGAHHNGLDALRSHSDSRLPARCHWDKAESHAQEPPHSPKHTCRVTVGCSRHKAGEHLRRRVWSGGTGHAHMNDRAFGGAHEKVDAFRILPLKRVC